MGSKPIIFLCLSLAIFLVTIASEVAARDTSLADYSAREAENKKEVKDAKYPGNGYGGGRRGGYPRGSYGGYRRYCPFGCCRRSYYGRGCKMCCAYRGEAAAAMDDEPPASSSKTP